MFFPTTTILDNFNRVNQGSPPSSNWSLSAISSSDDFKVISNQGVSEDEDANWYWNTESFSDSEVYFTFASLPQIDDFVTVQLRWDIVNDIAYGLSATTIDGVNYTLEFYYYDGASVNLFATYSKVLSIGDKIGISAIGSNISAYYKSISGIWTLLGSFTDTHLTSGYLGLYLSVLSPFKIDDFGGGEYDPTYSSSSSSSSSTSSSSSSKSSSCSSSSSFSFFPAEKLYLQSNIILDVGLRSNIETVLKLKSSLDMTPIIYLKSEIN